MDLRLPAAATAALMTLAAPAAAQTVEARYANPGPFQVEHVLTPPCDREGNRCDLYYPVSRDGRRPFPVVTWGNGTDRTPSPSDKYAFLLRHLASWGFVVIATQDGATGDGSTLLDALSFVRRDTQDPSSPLHGRVDLRRMGAAGHSQGASGAANAVVKSGGEVRSAVLFHLPQQAFCKPKDSCLRTEDLASARQGSLFYVSGSMDFVISPDWLPGGGGKLNSLTAYYEATPGGLGKAKGVLKGADHNDILGRPGCPKGQMGCASGVTGYLGFSTAWLVWRLQDEDLAPVFASGGEFHRSPSWTGVRTEAGR